MSLLSSPTGCLYILLRIAHRVISRGKKFGFLFIGSLKQFYQIDGETVAPSVKLSLHLGSSDLSVDTAGSSSLRVTVYGCSASRRLARSRFIVALYSIFCLRS